MPVESFACEGSNTFYTSASTDREIESISTDCAMVRPPSREEMKECSPCRAPSPQTTCTAMECSDDLSSSVGTAIFFDWDDTLLSSTFLAGRGYRLDSVISHDLDALAQLQQLETAVIGLLTTAMNYGRVHIVTNAETGWVQLSAQKFIPGVLPLLSKVSILSARSTFEKDHPGNALKWKYCAFQEHLLNLYGSFEEKTPKNILSFGDSHVEREAVRAATRGLANAKTKSVKFTERPSLEQLRRQIDLIANCFHHIHTHDGDLDLQLTVTVNTDDTATSSATSTETQTPAQTQTQTHTETSTTAPVPVFSHTPTPAYTQTHTPAYSTPTYTHHTASPFMANPFAHTHAHTHTPSAGRCGDITYSERSLPMPIAVVG